MLAWKRTTDPEVGSSNPDEYHQQKKGKGKSEIIGGGVSEEGSEGVGTTKDRGECQNKKGGVGGEMQKN